MTARSDPAGRSIAGLDHNARLDHPVDHPAGLDDNAGLDHTTSSQEAGGDQAPLVAQLPIAHRQRSLTSRSPSTAYAPADDAPADDAFDEELTAAPVSRPGVPRTVAAGLAGAEHTARAETSPRTDALPVHTSPTAVPQNAAPIAAAAAPLALAALPSAAEALGPAAGLVGSRRAALAAANGTRSGGQHPGTEHATTHDAVELDRLATQLYGRLRSQLASELLIGRERAQLLTDL